MKNCGRFSSAERINANATLLSVNKYYYGGFIEIVNLKGIWRQNQRTISIVIHVIFWKGEQVNGYQGVIPKVLVILVL